MKTSIIAFKWIPIAKLVPHPEAESFPRDSEDLSVMATGVGENGVLVPLHVLENPLDDGKWQVIDGVSRLLSASTEERGSGEDQKLPCLLVSTDDPASYVLNLNGCRRRVTTGTRILSYITCHKDDVLDEAEKVKNGEFKGNQFVAARLSGTKAHFWTAEAIAARLRVCQEDVRKAIELLRCRELRLFPAVKIGGKDGVERELDPDVEADVEIGQFIDQCYLEVMAGKSCVRRWMASMGGKSATKGKARKEIDLYGLASRTFPSLRTVFEGWDSVVATLSAISKEAQDKFWNDVRTAFQRVPSEVVKEIGGNFSTFTTEQLKHLAAAVEEELDSRKKARGVKR